MGLQRCPGALGLCFHGSDLSALDSSIPLGQCNRTTVGPVAAWALDSVATPTPAVGVPPKQVSSHLI